MKPRKEGLEREMEFHKCIHDNAEICKFRDIVVHTAWHTEYHLLVAIFSALL